MKIVSELLVRCQHHCLAFLLMQKRVAEYVSGLCPKGYFVMRVCGWVCVWLGVWGGCGEETWRGVLYFQSEENAANSINNGKKKYIESKKVHSESLRRVFVSLFWIQSWFVIFYGQTSIYCNIAKNSSVIFSLTLVSWNGHIGAVMEPVCLFVFSVFVCLLFNTHCLSLLLDLKIWENPGKFTEIMKWLHCYVCLSKT